MNHTELIQNEKHLLSSENGFCIFHESLGRAETIGDRQNKLSRPTGGTDLEMNGSLKEYAF